MNALIDKLADKALENLPGAWNIPDEFLEKFADLIVKECAKVLTQHGAYFSGEGEHYHYATSLIEEHFGVE